MKLITLLIILPTLLFNIAAHAKSFCEFNGKSQATGSKLGPYVCGVKGTWLNQKDTCFYNGKPYEAGATIAVYICKSGETIGKWTKADIAAVEVPDQLNKKAVEEITTLNKELHEIDINNDLQKEIKKSQCTTCGEKKAKLKDKKMEPGPKCSNAIYNVQPLKSYPKKFPAGSICYNLGLDLWCWNGCPQAKDSACTCDSEFGFVYGETR